MFESADMTREERIKLVAENNKVHFQTTYKFINIHRGFRPGKTHLVLGTPGGGKSTLRNSFVDSLTKTLEDNRVIFVWLSEESKQDFKSELAFNEDMNKKNVFVYSEQDATIPPDIQSFKEQFIKSNATIFIFDNITTSKLYGTTPREQGLFAAELKRMASESNTPFVIFAHTGSTIKEGHRGLIDQNDIRGSRDIVNLAEFLYIMQAFHIGNKVFTTIKIQKHRSQMIKQKLFSLEYSIEKKIYDKDSFLDFEDFKSLYRMANKL